MPKIHQAAWGRDCVNSFMTLVCVPDPSTFPSPARPIHGCFLTDYLPPGLVSTEVLKQPLHADYGHLFRVALQGRPVRFATPGPTKEAANPLPSLWHLLTLFPSNLKFSSMSLPRGAKAMSPWSHRKRLSCGGNGCVTQHSPGCAAQSHPGTTHLLSDIQPNLRSELVAVTSPEKEVPRGHARFPGI